MLPSIDVLKDQAARLITYLGDKHRVKLKRTAALEAIAAINRCPDWNTAHALATRGTEPPRKGGGFAHATYPLLWQNGLPKLAIARADWSRHVLTVGGSLADRQQWLQQQLHAQRLRGGAGVWLNISSTADRAKLQAMHGDNVRILPLTPDATWPEINILHDLDPLDVAEVLFSGLLSAPAEDLGDAHWLRVARTVLEAMALCVRVEQQPMTAENLRAQLDHPSKLNELLDPMAEPVKAAGCAMVSSRISLLFGPGLRRLFSNDPQAPGLSSVLAEQTQLIVEFHLADQRAAVCRQGGLLVSALRAAVRHRPRHGEHPLVLAMGEADQYVCGAMHILAEQGRGHELALLMTAPRELDMGKTWLGNAIMTANTGNKLHLGGMSEAAAFELMMKLTRAGGVLQSGDSIRIAEGDQ